MIKRKYFEIEKFFIKWVIRKRILFLIYLLTLFIIYLCFLVPYVNILMNRSLGFFLAGASAILLFRISIGKIAGFSIFLFLFSIPLVLIKEYARAEVIINLVYGFIMVGLIPLLLQLRDEK